MRLIEQEGLNLVVSHVEICLMGEWLPVCSRQWDNFDATVVCRQFEQNTPCELKRLTESCILFPLFC